MLFRSKKVNVLTFPKFSGVFFGILLLSSVSFAADAQFDSNDITTQQLSGAVSGFLKAENSPYVVKETIVVPEGNALVIDQGVTLYFEFGTGIDVCGGALSVTGEDGNPVSFEPAQDGGKWNGISITGNNSADINNAKINGAEIAVAVENGSADIRNSDILNSTVGVSAKAAKVNVQSSRIAKNTGVAVSVSNNARVSIDDSELNQNHAAIFASEHADVTMTSSRLTQNDYAVVDFGYNKLREHNTKIERNKIGIISEDIPLKNLKSVAKNNETDIAPGVEKLVPTLPPIPENPYAAHYRPLENKVEQTSDWNLSGTVTSYVGYHLVRTRHNYSGEEYVFGKDTIPVKGRYENYFQTPGAFTGLNTYMKLEAPEGRTLEFTADMTADRWSEYNLHTINMTYTDSIQKISLGDTYLSAGELYLAGVNVLGGEYDINLFKTSGGDPMFELALFAGESRKPKIVGDKNKDVYKDYIEEGEAESQEMIAGGKIKWNMHRRFNGALGFIGSNDYIENPMFRDGMPENTNTIDPKITSRTFFAEGNWLFWPGDIELNGQLAVGAADTANAVQQRAINEVFSAAGISVSNFALLKTLMRNPQNVNNRRVLSDEKLIEIFGDNTMMTLSEMRSTLIALLNEAKIAEKKYASKDEEKDDFKNWDGHNWAGSSSLRWELGNNTLIQAHLKIVGREFYSAGSPDQVSNYRAFGVSLDQKLMDMWKLTFAYDGFVENASSGDKTNFFGIAEGTNIGIGHGASSSWKNEHEQDPDRALFVHDALLGNVFDFGDFRISLKYKSDYRQRNRATRLYADYSAESGIYNDSWFKGNDYELVSGNDTIRVNAEKFAKYYSLADEEYLASGFKERIMKHTVEAEVAFKLPSNVLKIGGIWTYRDDLSKFTNDSMLDGFDFSDKTYGILGYYFNGANYFEQRYPISLATTFDGFRNNFSVTPRYKIYNRDSMKEFEWSVAESMEIPLSKDFLELALNGDARQLFVRRHADGKNEMEADISGSATLRVYYTETLFSDFTLGALYEYRPDSRADEFKDGYGVFTLNYAF